MHFFSSESHVSYIFFEAEVKRLWLVSSEMFFNCQQESFGSFFFHFSKSEELFRLQSKISFHTLVKTNSFLSRRTVPKVSFEFFFRIFRRNVSIVLSKLNSACPEDHFVRLVYQKRMNKKQNIVFALSLN